MNVILLPSYDYSLRLILHKKLVMNKARITGESQGEQKPTQTTNDPKNKRMNK